MKRHEFSSRFEYDVESGRLGGGAFGTVYKAYDHLSDQWKAIKIAEVKTIDNKQFSLIEEYNAIKSLPMHKNIANYEEVHQYKEPNGIFDYAIMQYYPEGNLKQLLERSTLSLGEKTALINDLLIGIAYLHKHSILHRDLKPSNILVSKNVTGKYIPKIADFGLAKYITSEQSLGMTNSFVGGSLEYCSPEQLFGKKLKYNADLWSFGIIAFEILSGHKPFVAGDQKASPESKRAIIYRKIVSAGLPPTIEECPSPYKEIIKACLIKEPSLRIQNATDLLHFISSPITQSGSNTPFPKEELVRDDETELISSDDIARDINKFETHLNLADEKFHLEDYNYAIEELQKAIKIMPGHKASIEKLELNKKLLKEIEDKRNEEEAYIKQIKIGDRFIQERRWDKAIHAYRTGLLLRPNDLWLVEKIKHVELEKKSGKNNDELFNSQIAEGNKLFEDENWLDAIQKYEEALLLDVDSKFVQNNIEIAKKKVADLGYSQAMKKASEQIEDKNFQLAIQFFNEAIVNRKDDPDALLGLQLAVEKLKNVEAISKWMEKADNAISSNNLNDALGFVNRILEIEPKHSIAQSKFIEIEAGIEKLKYESNLLQFNEAINSGELELEAGSYNEAISYFSKAIEIDPKSNKVLHLLQEARQQLALQEQEEEKKQKLNRFVLTGEQFIEAKEYDKAIASFQEANNLSPKDKNTLQLLNEAKAYLANEKRDIEISEVFVKGIKLINEKNPEHAKKVFEELLVKYPDDLETKKKISQIDKKILKQKTKIAAPAPLIKSKGVKIHINSPSNNNNSGRLIEKDSGQDVKPHPQPKGITFDIEKKEEAKKGRPLYVWIFGTLFLGFSVYFGSSFLGSQTVKKPSVKKEEAPNTKVEEVNLDYVSQSMLEEVEQLLKSNDISAIREFVRMNSSAKGVEELEKHITNLISLKDQKEWDKAILLNTISGYENYKTKSNEGQYLSQADQKITSLLKPVKSKTIEEAWSAISVAPSISAIEYFLSVYKDTEYVEKAMTLKSELEREVEKELADAVLASNDIVELKLFITRFPNSNFLGSIKAAILKIENEVELNAFNKAISLNSQASLESFIRSTKNVALKEKAKVALENIKGETKIWNNAIQSNLLADFMLYLRKYPSGMYAKKAKATIDKLEIVAFDKAKKANTIEAYDSFLNSFKDGKLSKEANLAKLELEEMDIVLAPIIAEIEDDFMQLNGGRFTMGCSEEESKCQSDEIPGSNIYMEGLAVSKYEVTQRLYRKVVGSNPSYYSAKGKDGCLSCPVENVTYKDVLQFISRLNKTPGNPYKYRLPTEAEWEFVASGGAKTLYAGSDNIDEVAVYGNPGGTKKVGTLKGNWFGVYDMSGNVAEWTSTWYDENAYAKGEAKSGPKRGQFRVIRGGSFRDKSSRCRVNNRKEMDPNEKSQFVGFRLVRSLK